ncbi:MAG TPA: hypothetical protein VKY92_19575 [Verrucomicrobiae bacterium]|nr:hypothetical protein [Verrucomicrobiae bacterium]
MIASQTEFSLAVAICAWCKPGERGGGLGAVSHGICLKHLRKLKLQVQGLLPEATRPTASKKPRVSRAKIEPLLPL